MYVKEHKELYEGLTKREYFAVMATQGMLCNVRGTSIPVMVIDALQCADALLEELSKPINE